MCTYLAIEVDMCTVLLCMILHHLDQASSAFLICYDICMPTDPILLFSIDMMNILHWQLVDQLY